MYAIGATVVVSILLVLSVGENLRQYWTKVDKTQVATCGDANQGNVTTIRALQEKLQLCIEGPAEADAAVTAARAIWQAQHDAAVQVARHRTQEVRHAIDADESCAAWAARAVCPGISRVYAAPGGADADR